MTKFDRLFKVNIGHNVTEHFDFHDVCKVLFMRILRRKFKNCEIYSEYHPERQNEVYPDVYLKIPRQQPIVFELQSEITEEWAKNIESKYQDEDLLIIPLNVIKKKWELRKEMYPNKEILAILREILEEYI